MKQITYYCDNCNGEIKDNEEYYLCLRRIIGVRKKQRKDKGKIICLKCFGSLPKQS